MLGEFFGMEPLFRHPVPKIETELGGYSSYAVLCYGKVWFRRALILSVQHEGEYHVYNVHVLGT